MVLSRLTASVLLAVLAAVPAAAGEARGGGWAMADAVVVHVTQQDLATVVADAFRSRGGPRLEGRRAEAGRGLHDLTYAATLSAPRLTLGEAGRARLAFEILEASVSLGTVERRLLGMRAVCEDLGAELVASRRVEIGLDLTLGLDDGRVTVTPDRVRTGDTGGAFELQRPSRCRGPVPTWLLWWLGKSHLQRKLAGLDEVLMASALELAEELNDRGGLLRTTLAVDPAGGRGSAGDVLLAPQWLRSGGGALTVSLAATAGDEPVAPAGETRAAGMTHGPPGTSWVAISERLIDRLLETAVPGLPGRPRPPGESWRRVVESDAFVALVPGLGRLDSPDELRLSVTLHSAPRVRLAAVAAGELPPGVMPPGRPTHPVVRIELDGIELGFWRASGDADGAAGAAEDLTHLGSVRVDAARIGVIPYPSVLGGVSLAVIDNTWEVSGRGIAVNEPLLAATLQELVFGELFETRYDPFARDGLPVAHSAFTPSAFRVVEGRLVMEFAPAAPGVLQANR